MRLSLQTLRRLLEKPPSKVKNKLRSERQFEPPNQDGSKHPGGNRLVTEYCVTMEWIPLIADEAA
jgi:hypothetical protein